LSIGKLLLAAFLVAIVSSCAGSLASLAVAQAHAGANGGGYSANVWITTLVLLGIGSFFALVVALWVVALPLTILLLRTGLPSVARDLILIALGTCLPPLALLSYFPLYSEATTIAFVYGLITSILWVLAIRFVGRQAPA
jgi:hypothetical protein